MFSGIIEELGQVRRISKLGRIAIFEVNVKKVQEDTKIGGSISVNGTCLTVIKKEHDSLIFYTFRTTKYSERELFGVKKGGEELFL